jgi:hypothetical protein
LLFNVKITDSNLNGNRKPYCPSAAIVERARQVNEAVLADCVMLPRFEIWSLATETERQLDIVERHVREGKNVLMVSLFVRWLQFSGVLNVIKLASHERGKALGKRLTELVMLCGEMQRGGKIDLKYAESDIVEINRKLDLLIAERGPVSNPAMVEVAAFKVPALLVLPSAADDLSDDVSAVRS